MPQGSSRIIVDSTEISLNDSIIKTPDDSFFVKNDSVILDSALVSDTAYSNTDLQQDTLTRTMQIKPKELPEAKLRVSENSDWYIVLLLFLFSIFASIRIRHNKYLNQLLQSTFNNNTASRLYRERISFVFHVPLRFDLMYYLTTSIILYELIDFHQIVDFYKGLRLYLLSLVITMLFHFFKIFFYRLSGVVFNVKDQIDEFLFNSKNMNRVTSLVVLPITILFFWAEGEMLITLLFISAFIYLIFFIIKIFKGIWIIFKNSFSVYYLILYLCTLEILPLLIVWRILWGV